MSVSHDEHFFGVLRDEPGKVFPTCFLCGRAPAGDRPCILLHCFIGGFSRALFPHMPATHHVRTILRKRGGLAVGFVHVGGQACVGRSGSRGGDVLNSLGRPGSSSVLQYATDIFFDAIIEILSIYN